MNVKERILSYASVTGISSREGAMAACLLEELKKMNIQARIDPNGNLHASLPCQNPDAKTLLLEAHMDQIGLMVSGVDTDGRLKFAALGGIDERMLCGLEVWVQSEMPIYGVIESRCGADEKKNKKNLKINELRIDLGFCQEEAEQKVKAGNVVSIGTKPRQLLGDKISAAALDNRAGIAAIMDCLDHLDRNTLPFHLKLLFSTGEELGLQGAYTGIEPENLDAAICIDVTHGLTPDTKDEIGVFPLSSGAVICRGPNLHYENTKNLLKLAKEQGIPHEIEVASGCSGTTAWAIQTAGNGIPTMLISIPLRYMHTNMETLAVRDVQAVSDLLTSVLTGGMALAE